MKKKLLLLLITGALSTTGCETYITEPEKAVLITRNTYESARDLDNLLYGAYGAVVNDKNLSGQWKVIPELLADHVAINVFENNPADPYLEAYNRNLALAQYDESWRLAYTAIQSVNLVIHAIDNNLITREKDPEFNEAVRNRIKGEAHFIRGVTYFELVRLYGHQYGFNSDAPNSGVILRTKPIINVTGKESIPNVGRATVQQVYDLVISDLKLAEELMPTESIRPRRATTYSAAAYLARVYFQKNDFPNALVQINKLLGDTPGLIETQFKLPKSGSGSSVSNAGPLNIFNMGSLTHTSSEDLFTTASVTGFLVDGVMKRKYQRTSSVQPHLTVSKAFISDVKFTSSDTRGTSSGFLEVVSGKTYTKKWNRATLQVPVIRSAELVLDRAEINAMKAATDPAALDAAIKDLNLLRDRSIKNYSAASTYPADKILAEVRLERIRELNTEGDRLHNLRRMGALDASVVVGPGDRTGVQPLPWNSNKLLLKIPDAEIRVNPLVVQNPD